MFNPSAPPYAMESWVQGMSCIQVYFALFYSKLIYCCNAWGITSEENIRSIEVLQRKCIRILTFSPYDSHVSNQTFIDLKFLKVRDVIKFFQLKLVYDFQCTILPTDLMELFQLSCEIRTDTFGSLNSIDKKLLDILFFNENEQVPSCTNMAVHAVLMTDP